MQLLWPVICLFISLMCVSSLTYANFDIETIPFDPAITGSLQCSGDNNIFRTQDGLFWRKGTSSEVHEILALATTSISYITIHACTPDGEWLGYGVTKAPRETRQYVYHFQTGQNILIGVGSFSFRWSPDGSKIQYAWYSELGETKEPPPSDRYFTIPENLPWKALNDPNAIDVNDTIWLPDSSAIIARDRHNRYQLKEFSVDGTVFSSGKIIWDGKNGIVNLRKITPANVIFFEYLSNAFGETHSMVAEKIITCKKVNDWRCLRLWENDMPTYYLYDITSKGSLIYALEDSTRKHSEIWIKRGSEQKKIANADGRITSLSVDNRFIYFYLVNDRNEYRLRFSDIP